MVVEEVIVAGSVVVEEVGVRVVMVVGAEAFVVAASAEEGAAGVAAPPAAVVSAASAVGKSIAILKARLAATRRLFQPLIPAVNSSCVSCCCSVGVVPQSSSVLAHSELGS